MDNFYKTFLNKNFNYNKESNKIRIFFVPKSIKTIENESKRPKNSRERIKTVTYCEKR